jgi:hypothetical protein
MVFGPALRSNCFCESAQGPRTYLPVDQTRGAASWHTYYWEVRARATMGLEAAVEQKEQSLALWLEIVSTIGTRHSLYYEEHRHPARPETVEARCPVREA